MLNDLKCGCPVYLACGYTDLRRGIDGLAGQVQTQFHLDPFQNALFLYLRTAKGPAQRAVLGGRRVCAGV